MQDPAPMLLLVDGSSYLYRAFHAMPDLRAVPGDPNSAPTGALRGIINMLQSLRKDYPAMHLACVFDAPGPTFRDALYPQYKANRSPMPDDLRAQIEPIHEVVRLLGWPLLHVPEVEADDVIGTLAKRAADQGWRVIISSGDKDLSQLVNEHITIIDTMNGKVRDVAGVTAEFGVPPSRMIDFQALVGDTVDNVPGVNKVGPKTAAKWLQTYGDLDALVAKASEVTGVVGENLRQALDWLPTARQLVTIRTDCDLSQALPTWPGLEALAGASPDLDALTAFAERFGFRGLMKSLQASVSGEAGGKSTSHAATREPVAGLVDAAPTGPAPAAVDLQVEIVTEPHHWAQWLARLQSAELVAIDTETDSLDAMQAQLVGISLSVSPELAAYVPLAHVGPDAPTQLPLAQVLADLKPWLENPRALKLGQHVKYDQHVFANHGIRVRGYAHDTLLQSYVLEVHLAHSLESLALRHLHREGLSYEDLCGKGAKQIPFAQVDVAQAARYSGEDASFTLQVHQVLWTRLQANPDLLAVYELEIATSDVLFTMERHGVCVDATTLMTQSHELGQRIMGLEQQAYELAGQPFNLGSPKQLGEIFFDKLQLPVIKKTATGARSTDEEVLEKLAEDYPLPAKILEYRSLAKLKNTYTDKLATLANPITGRVHTHYAQAVAVTGRLSSSDPNLQNIPIRTAEGRRVREAFVAPEGCVLASADYSQIELRIMAHISQDAALIAAFQQGLDVHRATAAEVFGLAPEAVSSEQRRYAKVINFGLIYGMSAFGLAKALGVDQAAAKAYIDRYFQRFAGVKAYMDDIREQAREQGYVQTVFGRRLYLPDIRANGPRRAGAERAAINAPMQGTAADLIKMSMVSVQATLDALNSPVKMIMQVHDELVFELPLSHQDWVRTEVPRLMAEVANLRVPLLAEVGMGPNWEQAH